MNFNANVGPRQPAQGPGRKIKRVSDLNAIGPSVPTTQFMPSAFDTAPIQQYTSAGPETMTNYNQVNPNLNFNYSQSPQINTVPTNQFSNYSNIPQQQHQQQQQPQLNLGFPSQNMGVGGGPVMSGTTNIPQQFGVFQQPIVQDMAMQYGQKLADQGKQIVESQFEKYVPVTRLKYYFAVDNKYVINKLRLLFFPFTHTDWSLKYDQDSPVQPRYDINAPDLYIPTMAYITYVVLAGFILGMQNRFSPEQLGIQASSALAYSIFELVIYSITLYVSNISTTLKTLDLVSYSGYKYAIIVACILISILFQKSGYYIALIYCSLSLGFFLLRTLKTKVLNDPAQPTTPVGQINYDPYGAPQQTQSFEYTAGRKRKLYFLFLIVGCQSFLSFWLSMHLISTGTKLPNTAPIV